MVAIRQRLHNLLRYFGKPTRSVPSLHSNKLSERPQKTNPFLRRFHAIQQLGRAERRLAVEAGLRFGSRSELSDLIDLASSEADGKAWPGLEDALVVRWAELRDAEADRAADLIKNLTAAVLRLAISETGLGLQGVCAAAGYAIARLGVPVNEVADLAAACAVSLGHSDPAVAAAAERAMLVAVERSDEDAGGHIESVVAEAARQYAVHGRAGVMHAAAKLASRRNVRGPVANWLKIAGPERSAFAAALRAGRDEGTGRLRAWEFLAKTWAASACEDRLMRSAGVAEQGQVLAAWWLAMNPARAAKLRQPKLASAIWPGVDWAEPMHRHAAFALSKYAKPDARSMFASCELALADPDPAVRLAAVELAPRALLNDLCFDQDASVARAAAIRVSGVGEPGREPDELWEKLARSPHESVRHIAAGELVVGRSDTWSALARDPAGTESGLLRAWEETAEHARAELIGRVRRAGLEPLLADQLIETVRAGEPGDPSVSAAASALATVPGAAATDALAEGMHRDDARLRSNAVEALVRRERVLGERSAWLPISLLELKDDPHHRVRATSLRAISIRASVGEDGNVARGLAASGAISLSRGGIAERLAGLWLADRLLGLAPVAASWREELIEIARGCVDETGRLGERARSILDRFDEKDEDQEPGAALALVE